MIDGDPENIKFYHKLGDFYMAREIFDKAAEIFGKIVEKNRSDLEATKKYKDATARGSIASQKWDSNGDWRDLLKDKNQSKELESKGRAAMTPEMLAAQAEQLLAEYSADQNNLDVTKKLAATYEQLEDFQTSLQFYEWALHLSHNDPSLEKKVASIRETVNKAYLDQLRQFVEENPATPTSSSTASSSSRPNKPRWPPSSPNRRSASTATRPTTNSAMNSVPAFTRPGNTATRSSTSRWRSAAPTCASRS